MGEANLMAVYCGVCGVRIGAATENDGAFSTNIDFKGWDVRRAGGWDVLDPAGRPKIEDTCEECGALLREVVTKAANEIVAKHAERVAQLSVMLRKHAEDAQKLIEEKAEFERDWRVHRARRT
jgi:hypothetical protein